MVRAFILLGGLFGPDGVVTSAGMYGLANMLEKLPGVGVTTYCWSDWQNIVPLLYPRQGGKVAVLGYSGGGSRATWLADSSSGTIDLMVLYDPSPSWQMKPIGGNVLHAVCYHNTWPLFFGLGGGVLTTVPEYSGKLETIDIAEQHLAVQFNPDLHARTVALVRSLCE